jgi:DNA-directed RNA polymerase subunit RPC12/RpoP
MRVPQYWRVRVDNYRLTGSVCRSCGHKAFPAREHCPACRSRIQTAIPVEIVLPLPLAEWYEFVRVEARPAVRDLCLANQRDV